MVVYYYLIIIIILNIFSILKLCSYDNLVAKDGGFNTKLEKTQ